MKDVLEILGSLNGEKNYLIILDAENLQKTINQLIGFLINKKQWTCTYLTLNKPYEAIKKNLVGKYVRFRSVDSVIEEIGEWLHSLDLPTDLKYIGIDRNQIQAIEDYALEDPCCPLNPRKVEKGEVVAIIDNLL